jgi:hypothetical protein
VNYIPKPPGKRAPSHLRFADSLTETLVETSFGYGLYFDRNAKTA